jgi:AraC-like DNA-binding protein
VVESELPIVEIALRCGYQNASAMTRAFKAEFGNPPRNLRVK